jgi:Na+/H+-dicarboxylate symporter
MAQSSSQTQPPPPPPRVYAVPPVNGLAVAGLVLGILSVLLCWLHLFDLPIAVVGLVLSIVGLGRSNQLGGSGRGMAIGGIVTSAVGLAAALTVMVLLYLWVFPA